MKTRTWSTEASFSELHRSSCNTALCTKPRLFFFSLVRIMYFYGWVLHQCTLLTQGTKKKNLFLFLCLCITTCAKRKYVWTLLCSLLRNYLKCEVSSFLLAIMIPYLKHSNYLLISLSSVVFLCFLLLYKIVAMKIITVNMNISIFFLILKGPIFIE